MVKDVGPIARPSGPGPSTIRCPAVFMVVQSLTPWTAARQASLSFTGPDSYFPLAMLYGMWDLSPLSRAQTCTLCVGRQILNRGTAREVPGPVSSPLCISVFSVQHRIMEELTLVPKNVTHVKCLEQCVA